MINSTKLHNNQQGMILVSVILVVSAMLIIGISLAGFTMSQYTLANRKISSTNANAVAEAGIEQSVQALNQDDNFPGYSETQIFFNNQTQGRGTFTTTIEDAADSNTKIITSTGNVYRYNQNSNPKATRKVRVTVVGTTAEGYAVHTGPGGLILGGAANITNSDVFVGGTITMTGAARIGTYSQPLEVNVAHQSCPTGSNPGPTYPRVCNSGENGQPISLQWSTFIFGSVCATNQTSTGPNQFIENIQPGSTGQGLISGCTAPPASPPTYSRAAHIANMTTTGSGNSNSYVCNSWPFDRDWPANLRLNGNVNVGGICDVTIHGDVYITGNLDFGGVARIRVADSVGTDRPVIVVDGDIDVGGAAHIIANDSGTGAHFISFKTNAACNPNCTELTGNELKNSQNLKTVDIGGAANLPGMIFQSYWGEIELGGIGHLGAAAGQTIDMSGAGTITFGTELSSGERSWTITSYQQDFD